MSDKGKSPIYTTQEEYDREVEQLRGLDAELVALQDTLAEYQTQFATAEGEYSKAQTEYDERWADNRQLARNVRYWQERISTFKGLQKDNENYLFWQKRSEDLRFSLTERDISRRVAQRLKPKKGYEPGRVDTYLVLAESRRSTWSGEQEKVLAQINSQRDRVNYLRDARNTLFSDIQDQRRSVASKKRVFSRVRNQIARKRIKPPPPTKNQMIALHKRWQYDSARGPGHDISVEAIATIVVGPEARKEDYERELEDALDTWFRNTQGFERLQKVEEEVLGFEATSTDEKQRSVKVEEYAWEHKIVERQLTLDNYIKGETT
jgi:hypothetical protein